MAYIGRPINAGNLAVQSGTGDGSDTTPIATLNYATTTNGIAVYLDGVRQLAGTDYNVTNQTTLTFTTAPANGVGVDVYFLGLEVSIPTPADSSISTANIANNAVDETKLKDALIGDFTDATVTASDTFLYGDATDSGNTKRDTVQGILDLAGGGAWNLIGTSVASDSATLDQTGLDGTYDLYAVGLSEIHPATGSAILWMRFGDSSGFDSGSTDYDWHVASWNAAAEVRNSSGASKIELTHEDGVTTASGDGYAAMLYLARGGNGTTTASMSGTAVTHGAGGANRYSHLVSGHRDTAITLDRVQILFSTGNIASGRMTVWGIAHA